MGETPTYRTKAFISYSHENRAYLQRLQQHLRPYLRESAMQVWDDTQIQPGADWMAAIERGLAEAQVTILLVSVAFLASDFVAYKELPRILAAAKEDGATILPVILEHCAFRRSPLSRLQAINDPDTPLGSLSAHEQDKIWSKVAELTSDTLKAKEQEWQAKAKSLFEAGKHQEALVACEHALQFNPNDAAALRYKGAALYYIDSSPSISWADGQTYYQKALDALERAIQLESGNAFAHKYKGMVLYRINRYEEALAPLEVALKSDSRDTEILQRKGYALFSLQRYEEVLAPLDQTLKFTSGNDFIYKYKGAALFHLQRYEEALAALDQALKFAPNDAFIHKYKGAALFHLQRYEEALTALEHATNSWGDTFAEKYQGAALFHLGREVEALAALEQLLAILPAWLKMNDAFAYKYKGAALVNLEAETEALAALERALTLEPDDVFALSYKGAALLGLRKYEEALGVLEQALQRAPGDAFALRLKSKIEKILAYKKQLAANPTQQKR